MRVASSAIYLSRAKARGLDPACDDVQDLVEALKRNDPAAIDAAAELLAGHPALRDFDGTVVATPRSSDRRPQSNVALAEALVDYGVGSRAVPAVARVVAVPSSRARRRKYGSVDAGVPYAEHRRTMAVVEPLGTYEPVLLVDDILTSGTTLMATADTLEDAGHRGARTGAVLAYYEDDTRRAAACPVDFRVFTLREDV